MLLVYKNIKKLSLNIKFRIFNPFSYCADRASFCVLFSCLKSWQEAQPELHQAFEVNTAQTSGLANLVFSYQTVFFRVRASIYGKLMVTTKFIVPSAWLLGLIGTCPTRILLDSCSLPWVCPNQGNKNALPAGYNFSGNGNTAVFFNTGSKIWRHPPHPWPLHWACDHPHDQEQQPDLTFSFGVLWLVSSINPPWSVPVLWLWDRPPFSSE